MPLLGRVGEYPKDIGKNLCYVSYVETYILFLFQRKIHNKRIVLSKKAGLFWVQDSSIEKYTGKPLTCGFLGIIATPRGGVWQYRVFGRGGGLAGGCAEGTEWCQRHCRPYQVPLGTTSRVLDIA